MLTARRRLRFLGTLIAFVLTIAPRASTPGDWSNYTNVRYQYTICYPSGSLHPPPEATNGDGRSFLGKDGEKMLVYGSEQLGQSLTALEAQTSLDMAGRSGAVLYERHTKNWFVLSGQNGSTTFYVKTYLSGGQFKSFRLTYPTADAIHYDPIAERISHCFVDLASQQ